MGDAPTAEETLTKSAAAAAPSGGNITVPKGKTGFVELAPGPGHYGAYGDGNFHWGVPGVIRLVQQASVAWFQKIEQGGASLARESERALPLFAVGDISDKDGVLMNSKKTITVKKKDGTSETMEVTFGHYTHTQGNALDVMVFRRDRLRQRYRHGPSQVDLYDAETGLNKVAKQVKCTACDSQGGDASVYDRDLTRDFIDFFIDHCKPSNFQFVIFNDDEVIEFLKGKYGAHFPIGKDDTYNKHTDKKGRESVTWIHYNHVHFHLLPNPA
ncbi:MAG: hypothetical protein U0414_20085 [Polyangiaceae bacterium]